MSRRSARIASILALGLASTAQPLPVAPALPAAINAIRLHGCGGRKGVNQPLRSIAQLNEAARRTAAGARLQDALLASGYGAAESAYIHVMTPGGDPAIARLLEERFCTQISESTERDIGITRRGDEVWIVLAAPLETPRAEDAPNVSARVLELVNEARAHARSCGPQAFGATAPLKLSPALGQAALAHSLDMATRGYFDHTAPDGTTPASRATHAGYAWRAVGENSASGVPTPEEAVAGWLHSPGHCQNLMDPRFTDMGVSYAVSPQDPSAIFWTQLFGQADPAAARGTRQ
jgi:uncharacterized protein YkwD